MTGQTNINEKLISYFSEKSQSIYAGMAGWQINEFQDKVLTFLKCRTYPEAETAADSLSKYIMDLHGKLEAFRRSFDDLDRIEKQLNAGYQRLHFVHQAHVFLLGLYLYGTCPQIKTEIDQEMYATSVDFLSGGDATGEFLFRWRMAALVHDLGYSLSLLADNDQLDAHICGFQRIIERPIARPEELYHYDNKNLFNQMSDRVRQIYGFSLRPIAEGLSRIHPYASTGKKPPFYDHGILSAVIFLYLVNHEYIKGHESSLPILGYELSWDQANLDHSILNIAIAVALHNLDAKNYDISFKLRADRYYRAKPSPFAWLLKTCDMLQEWDKPQTSDHEKMEGPLESLKINFIQSDGVIEVINFPPKEDVKRILEGYGDPPIKFKINFEQVG